MQAFLRVAKAQQGRRLSQDISRSSPFSTYGALRSGPTSEKSALLDRESINTEGNEYSKSGSDEAAASAENPSAFEPGEINPKSELNKSGESDGPDSLDMSPANKDISDAQVGAANDKEKAGDRGSVGSGPDSGKNGK